MGSKRPAPHTEQKLNQGAPLGYNSGTHARTQAHASPAYASSLSCIVAQVHILHWHTPCLNVRMLTGAACATYLHVHLKTSQSHALYHAGNPIQRPTRTCGLKYLVYDLK